MKQSFLFNRKLRISKPSGKTKKPIPFSKFVSRLLLFVTAQKQFIPNELKIIKYMFIINSGEENDYSKKLKQGISQ